MANDKDKTDAQLLNKSAESRQPKTEFKVSEPERKWAEKELRQSEEKYRKLFNFSPIGTALFDLEGKYIEANDAYARILGLPKKELLSRAAGEFIEEEVLEKTQEDIDELFIKGVTGGIRELQIHDNNLVLSYVNTLLYDNEEKPVGIISIIQDITELKGPEQAIKEARELTEGISDTELEPLVEPRGELKEIPAKRSFFDIFRIIPKKIERDMKYELENRESGPPKLQGIFGKFLQKSFDLDDFEDQHETPTIFRRITRRYKL